MRIVKFKIFLLLIVLMLVFHQAYSQSDSGFFHNQDKEAGFQKIEIMPSYPGGIDALLKYVQQNINYPKQAKDANISGIVYVNFIVNKRGQVYETSVVKGITPVLDEEALRVVNTISGFKPEINDERRVKVSYTIPVNFKLEKPKTIVENKIATAEPKKETEVISPKPETPTTTVAVNEKGLIAPEYPGGDAALLQFIQQNITYPEVALKNKITGTVEISYRIDKEGNVKDVSVLNGVNPLLDNEAVRVVKLVKGYKPARENGRIVEVALSLPIKFQMNSAYSFNANKKILDSTDYSDDQVYTILDDMPKYPGGDVGLFKFIKENINYPTALKNKKVEGVVNVSFIIDQKGAVQDVKVLKSVHPLLDAEAERVVKLIKGFTPGKQNGKPVKIMFSLPVRFEIN